MTMKKQNVTHISRHSEEIIQAIKEGKPLKEISTQYECAVSTLYTLMRKEGYTRTWIKEEKK